MPEEAGLKKKKAHVVEKDTRKPWEKWEAVGQPVYYVSFHDPVPVAKNMEPVGEFRLETKEVKYKVQQMIYTPYGLVFWVNGEGNIVGLANVKLVRFYT